MYWRELLLVSIDHQYWVLDISRISCWHSLQKCTLNALISEIARFLINSCLIHMFSTILYMSLPEMNKIYSKFWGQRLSWHAAPDKCPIMHLLCVLLLHGVVMDWVHFVAQRSVNEISSEYSVGNMCTESRKMLRMPTKIRQWHQSNTFLIWKVPQSPRPPCSRITL